MSEENVILTDDQVQAVYDKLEEESTDTTKSFIDEFEETKDLATTVEDMMTEINQRNSIPNILGGMETPESLDGEDFEFDPAEAEELIKNTNITSEHISSALQPYKENNMLTSDEDVITMMDVLSYYKEHKDDPNDTYEYYPELTEEFKTLADQLSSVSGESREEGARSVVKMLYDSAIGDAIVDEYQDQMSELNASFQTELSDTYLASLKENDEKYREFLKENNPEALEKYDAIVDDAHHLKHELNFITNKVSRKKLDKFMKRFNDDRIYFNSRIKMFEDGSKLKIITRYKGVKNSIADRIIDVLVDSIGIEREIAERFFIVVCKVSNDLDATYMWDVVYMHNVLETILRFEFIKPEDDPESTEIIKGICNVIRDKE